MLRLTLLILCGLTLGYAESMTVASHGTEADTNEFNDRTGANVSLLKTGYDSAWDVLPGAEWISFAPTVCPGCTNPKDSPDFFNPSPDNPYVTFSQFFNIPKGMVPVGGILNVLSDDSIEVNLNDEFSSKKKGYLRYSEDFMEPDTTDFNYEMQDGNGIEGGMLYATSLQSALVPGLNLLRFRSTNLGAHNVGSNGDGTGGVSSFGIAYILRLELLPEALAFSADWIRFVPPAFLPDSPDPAPEPASMLLAGAGLALGYAVRARRRRVFRRL